MVLLTGTALGAWGLSCAAFAQTAAPAAPTAAGPNNGSAPAQPTVL
jgi:hypothetical protein